MDVSRIDYEISTGEFFKNPALITVMDSVKRKDRALHLMGLLSDGQVHSSLEHLYALLRMAKAQQIDASLFTAFWMVATRRHHPG